MKTSSSRRRRRRRTEIVVTIISKIAVRHQQLRSWQQQRKPRWNEKTRKG